MIRTTRTVASRCTNCGEKMSAATPVGDDFPLKPEPGALAICIECHHLMVYRDDMRLRNLTDDEVVEVAGSQELVRAMEALGEFKKWKAKREAAQSPARKR